MLVVKPMLAKAAPADLSVLSYPLVVQPKFDGIRALIVDGVVQSRSGKAIPNAEIQAELGRSCYNGLDGELCVGPTTASDLMQRTTEFVMAPNKTGAAWTFQVFDLWNLPSTYEGRLAVLVQRSQRESAWPERARLVSGDLAVSADDVTAQEGLLVDKGYEGAILRDPRAAYKHGRSGSKGPLLKLKRFIDFEAVVIGVEEQMHNGNENVRDAFGRSKRSTAKAGKVPAGVLGKLICRTPEGVEFGIGTGYTAEQRALLWEQHITSGSRTAGLTPHEPLIGRLVKYKSFPVGVKDAPRFPVFLGFRDPIDTGGE